MLFRSNVAYFGIDGPIVVNAANKQSLQTAISALKGIDINSLRISLETGSLSLAFDPKAVSYATLLEGLEKKLKQKNLTIFPLDVITQMPKATVASR